MVRITNKVRVLVVEDDALYKLALTKAFANIAQVQSVDTVSTLAEAKERLERGGIDMASDERWPQ